MKKKKVLVIEDSFKEIFDYFDKREDVESTYAYTYAEARTKLNTMKFDLIIMDYKLDGIVSTNLFKECVIECPVLAFSDSTSGNHELIKAGAVGGVIKEWSPELEERWDKRFKDFI